MFAPSTFCKCSTMATRHAASLDMKQAFHIAFVIHFCVNKKTQNRRQDLELSLFASQASEQPLAKAETITRSLTRRNNLSWIKGVSLAEGRRGRQRNPSANHKIFLRQEVRWINFSCSHVREMLMQHCSD